MEISDFSIQSLYQSTIQTEEEMEFIEFCVLADFRHAITELSKVGMTFEKIQLFMKLPFSRFRDQDYKMVVLLALAIQKKTITVEKLLQVLIDREYWAHLKGGTTVNIDFESLPNIDTIKIYLNLADNRMAPQVLTE